MPGNNNPTKHINGVNTFASWCEHLLDYAHHNKVKLVELISKNGELIGICYVSQKFGIPNIGWYIREDHRHKGFGESLAVELIHDYRILFVKTANSESEKLAMKLGFRHVIGKYWVRLNVK